MWYGGEEVCYIIVLQQTCNISKPPFPLDPAFPGASGEWVLRQDFPGEKSFGRFECEACDNRWGSAHSWKDYPQDCRDLKCETKTFPSWMWLNDDNWSDDTDSTSSTSVSRGPHHGSRCGKCITLGRVCTTKPRNSGRLRKSDRHFSSY